MMATLRLVADINLCRVSEIGGRNSRFSPRKIGTACDAFICASVFFYPAPARDRVSGVEKARGRMMKNYIAAGLTIAAIAAVCGRAEALDRRVRIINDSKHTLTAFFGTNVAGPDSQDSLLGSDTLRPGTSIVLDFEDGSGYCRFRFRAVFDDGVEVVRPSVNVCEVGTYRYTE
jgi:hypothetical protein